MPPLQHDDDPSSVRALPAWAPWPAPRAEQLWDHARVLLARQPETPRAYASATPAVPTGSLLAGTPWQQRPFRTESPPTNIIGHRRSITRRGTGDGQIVHGSVSSGGSPLLVASPLFGTRGGGGTSANESRGRIIATFPFDARSVVPPPQRRGQSPTRPAVASRAYVPDAVWNEERSAVLSPGPLTLYEFSQRPVAATPRLFRDSTPPTTQPALDRFGSYYRSSLFPTASSSRFDGPVAPVVPFVTAPTPRDTLSSQGLSLKELRETTAVVPFEGLPADDALQRCHLSMALKRSPSAPDAASRDVSRSHAYDADSDSARLCAICCSMFMTGDPIRLLAPCGHRYHVRCVDRWFESNGTCPICRRSLKRPHGAPLLLDTEDNNILARPPPPATPRLPQPPQHHATPILEEEPDVPCPLPLVETAAPGLSILAPPPDECFSPPVAAAPAPSDMSASTSSVTTRSFGPFKRWTRHGTARETSGNHVAGPSRRSLFSRLRRWKRPPAA